MFLGFSRFLMEEAGEGSGGAGAPAGEGSGGQNQGDQGGGTPAPGGTGGAQKFELPDNWKDSLPDDLRGEPSLGTIHSFEGLVKSFVHAQKSVGTTKVPIPKSDATDSEWGEVFSKLGRPENFEGYEIKPPEGYTPNDDFLKGFKQTAHEAGLLPKQVEKLFGWYANKELGMVTEMKAQREAQIEKAQGALKKEWGEAYDQELGRALGFLQEHGGEEVFKSIEQAGLGSDPAFIKTMHKLAKEFGTEGTIASNKLGGGGGRLTPQEAQAKINEIMSDPKSPYFDKSNPRHGDVVQEMQKLFKQAHV